jgi:hypothetical protein
VDDCNKSAAVRFITEFQRSSVMIDVRGVFATSAFLILLAGCEPSAKGPSSEQPAIADKPDVVITLDGQRHACVVALYSEAQGSAISCNDVVPFLKDELRVPAGAIYDIRTIPDVDAAELAKVQTNLMDAGYRFIGGRHEMPLTEPNK